MINKIDTYDKYKKFINSNIDNKIKVLIHACCAPCSSEVLEELKQHCDITIYYYNPNIYPEEEFFKRLETQKEIVSKLNFDVKILVGDYDYNIYTDAVKGLEHLGEGSNRCYNCYYFRMKKCSEVASELNYDYFTTTLSISPYKNSNWINKIGKEVEIKSKYLYSNFKKEEGYKKSIVLSKQYNLYRQDYCGCISSIKEHEIRINKNR